MEANKQKEILRFFEGHVTPNRYQRFQEVLKERTEYMCVVLENIYNPQNSSAVIRSADCFGIQNVHIIEGKWEFRTHEEITKGSSKWVNVSHHEQKEDNNRAVFRKLKEEGYRLVATSPHVENSALKDFDVTAGKFALIMGNEMDGITDLAREEADAFIQIPMYGFTESFNLSVAASICFHHLTYKIREAGVNWQLSKSERDEILYRWFYNSISGAGELESRYWEEKV